MKMTSRQFYDKRLSEDNTIGSVQLMEEYAKYIVKLNFYDNTPVDFEECKINDLEVLHKKTGKLLKWADS